MGLKSSCTNFRATLFAPATFAASANVVHAADPAGAGSAPDAPDAPDAASAAEVGTAQSFGGDQTNQPLQVKLRGSSPNDAPILINGKRRHTTVNLPLPSGAYQRGAAIDLNFILV